MKHPVSNHHDEERRYVNRDLSWLEFNRRVLEEAQDNETPLLERLKFLSIVSTNLDEFFSVRVAGLTEQIKAGDTSIDFTGYTPAGLVKRIMKRSSGMVAEQYAAYSEIMRNLGEEGLVFVSYKDLNKQQKKSVDQYYQKIVFPILTPITVDLSRPFLLAHHLGNYFAVLLCRKCNDTEDETFCAIVQIPAGLPRYFKLPVKDNSMQHQYILLDQIIEHHIQTLFSEYTTIDVHGFRLTRNADMTLNEEGSEDLLEEIEKELKRRRWGSPVRLEVQKGIHSFSLEMLKDQFQIREHVFVIDGPLDLSYLMKFASSIQGKEHLKYPHIVPAYPSEFAERRDMFRILRDRDVMVFHPYESFEAVTDFLEQAAGDANVLAIKMTLYRVSGNFTVMQALVRAAEAGKQVTVVVELKARFDEERNIAWARQLEKAGCHVVYGLTGFKTHAKLMLILRREGGSLRPYVHVGTGNYNDNTAKLYTDLGLFTSHPAIGEDASAIFNEITGYSAPRDWLAVGVSPADLKSKLIRFIRREAERAAAGEPARIIAKINALSSQEMVDELYAASQAGVQIELIVRGICCLRPGVRGLSEHIKVISIIDRFLEHSRIFYFENGGEHQVWLSSADWMSRNLDRRIELMWPVFDHELQQNIIRILRQCLNDNVKARYLQQNGKYTRPQHAGSAYRSQFTAQEIANWKTKPFKDMYLGTWR